MSFFVHLHFCNKWGYPVTRFVHIKVLKSMIILKAINIYLLYFKPSIDNKNLPARTKIRLEHITVDKHGDRLDYRGSPIPKNVLLIQLYFW